MDIKAQRRKATWERGGRLAARVSAHICGSLRGGFLDAARIGSFLVPGRCQFQIGLLEACGPIEVPIFCVARLYSASSLFTWTLDFEIWSNVCLQVHDAPPVTIAATIAGTGSSPICGYCDCCPTRLNGIKKNKRKRKSLRP